MSIRCNSTCDDIAIETASLTITDLLLQVMRLRVVGMMMMLLLVLMVRVGAAWNGGKYDYFGQEFHGASNIHESREGYLVVGT